MVKNVATVGCHMLDKLSSACRWSDVFPQGSPIRTPPYDWLDATNRHIHVVVSSSAHVKQPALIQIIIQTFCTDLNTFVIPVYMPKNFERRRRKKGRTGSQWTVFRLIANTDLISTFDLPHCSIHVCRMAYNMIKCNMSSIR